MKKSINKPKSSTKRGQTRTAKDNAWAQAVSKGKYKTLRSLMGAIHAGKYSHNCNSLELPKQKKELEKTASMTYRLMMASERVLAKDWDNKEEDEAWAFPALRVLSRPAHQRLTQAVRQTPKERKK